MSAVAATSQSGAQVARRKPVIQGRPAEKILSRSPTTAPGRELTRALVAKLTASAAQRSLARVDASKNSRGSKAASQRSGAD